MEKETQWITRTRKKKARTICKRKVERYKERCKEKERK